MLQLVYSSAFERDVKPARRRGNGLEKLKEVIRLLENEQPLPERLRDHPPKGSWKGHRDCHIELDWLLIL